MAKRLLSVILCVLMLTTSISFNVLGEQIDKQVIEVNDIKNSKIITSSLNRNGLLTSNEEDGFNVIFHITDPLTNTDIETKTIAVTKGSSISSSTIPTVTTSYTTHTFGGYYTMSYGTGIKYFNDDYSCADVNTWALNGNLDLYSYWVPKDIVITFNANGGSNLTENSKTIKYGQSIGQLPTATYSGKDLVGWFNEDTEYFDNDILTESITLTAHWADKRNKITYLSGTYNTNKDNSSTSEQFISTIGGTNKQTFIYGSLMTSGTYILTGDTEFKAPFVNYPALKIEGDVYIYIPKGFTLTVTGANGNNANAVPNVYGKTANSYANNSSTAYTQSNTGGTGGTGADGGGAGIGLVSGNNLYILGEGTLKVTGGKGGDAGDGGNGSNAQMHFDVDFRTYTNPNWAFGGEYTPTNGGLGKTFFGTTTYGYIDKSKRSGAGGGGGGGAAGGGAAIGTKGSDGGAGGSGGNSSYVELRGNSITGNNGSDGYGGSIASTDIGKFYIARTDTSHQITLSLTPGAGGSKGSAGSTGYNAGWSDKYKGTYSPTITAAAGGSGGGGGGAAWSGSTYGSGGSSAGGGGGGGSGGIDNADPAKVGFVFATPSGGLGGRGSTNGASNSSTRRVYKSGNYWKTSGVYGGNGGSLPSNYPNKTENNGSPYIDDLNNDKYKTELTFDNQNATTIGTTRRTMWMAYDGEVENSTSITVPTKTGYSFNGYYTGINGTGDLVYASDGTLFGSDSQTAKKLNGLWEQEIIGSKQLMTLYADWDAINNDILLHNVDQNNVDQTFTITMSDGKLPSLSSSEIPTKVGYVFAGYWTSENGQGIQYYNSEGEPIKNYVNDTDLELYAYWIANTNTSYVVNHYKQNADGTYSEIPTDTENLYGTTDTSVTPSVKSYIGFTSPQTQTVTILADGSLVVKYYYTRNKYSIVYNGNGSTSGTMSNSEHTYDVDKELTQNSYERKYTVTYDANEGTCDKSFDTATYKFSGWNTSIDGTGTPYTDNQSVTNLSSTDKDTITLYAQWDDDSVVLPSPTRTGYIFDGWYDALTDGEKIGKENDSYTPSANTTLYAKWIEKLTVTVSSKGIVSGNVLEHVGQLTGGGDDIPQGKPVTLTATENSGDVYRFDHWEINNENVGTNSTLEYTFNENTNVYAIYRYERSNGIKVNVEAEKPFTMKIKERTSWIAWDYVIEGEYNVDTPVDNLYKKSIYVTPGSRVELIYNNSNNDFVAWVNTVRSIESTNPTYLMNALYVEKDIKLETKKPIGDNIYFAKFISDYSQIISSGEFTDLTGLKNLKPTSGPSKMGYNFVDWTIGGTKLSEITSNDQLLDIIKELSLVNSNTIEIKPVYEKATSDSNNFTVTINQSILKVEPTLVETIENVSNGSAITLTAPEVEGYVFAYWTLENSKLGNSIIVSYDEKYEAKITNNVTYCAHYDSQETEKQPVISASVGNTGTGENIKVAFVVSRNVPEDDEYELVENGVIYSTNTSFGEGSNQDLRFIENSDNNYKLSSGVYNITNYSNIKSSNYTLTLSVYKHEDSPIYLRGYMIVVRKDDNDDNVGTKEIIYTDLYKVTYNTVADGTYTIIPVELGNSWE